MFNFFYMEKMPKKRADVARDLYTDYVKRHYWKSNLYNIPLKSLKNSKQQKIYKLNNLER